MAANPNATRRWLKKIQARYEVSQRQMAEAIGQRGRSAIGMYMTGSPMPDDVRDLIAAAYPNVPPPRDDVDEDEAETMMVPYWGMVPCGEWEAPQGDVTEIAVPAKLSEFGKHLIAVRVSGESMAPLYMPGDVVPVRKTVKPIDGAVTLVQNENRDLTLKIARSTPRGWEFHSLNPKHGQAKGEQVIIIGVAVYVPERFDRDAIRV